MKICKIDGVIHYRENSEAYLKNDKNNKILVKDIIPEKRRKLEEQIRKENEYKKRKDLQKNLDRFNQKFTDKRIEKLQNSIDKNIICKDIKSNELYSKIIKEINGVPNINNKAIIDLAYKYDLKKIVDEINKLDKINIKIIREKIYEHKKNIIETKSNKLECQLYLNEVKECLESQFSKARKKSKEKLDYTQIRGIIRNRIINKITQYYILKGKLQFYECTDYVNTDILNEIKANESLKKHFLTAIVAVRARLENIIDVEKKSEKDNTVKKVDDIFLDGDIKIKDLNLLKICLGESVISEDKSKSEVDSMKKAIAQIRHNIVHFKNANEFYKKLEHKLEPVQINIIRKCLSDDIDNATEVFTKNIENLSIKEYLLNDEEKRLYHNLKFDFNLNDNNFIMTPSFSNVYKKGTNMANHNRKYNKIYDIYKDDKIAYKNLLMLVYKYDFISKVNDEILTDAINEILEINKNKNKVKDEEKNKYKEIEELWNDKKYDDISEFLEEIQKNEMIKASQIQENNNETTKNKYTDFIRDIYSFAFAKHCNDLIHNLPNKPLPNEEQKDNIIINIKCFSDLLNKDVFHKILPFYCMFKFMDNYEIADLQSQIKKYISAISKIKDDSKNKDKSKIKDESKNKDDDKRNNIEFYKNLYLCSELVKIIKPKFALVAEKQDEVNEYNKKIVNEYISNFIEDNCKDFYTQNGEKPVYYKGITDFVLSGRNDTYKNIFKKIKIKNSDIERYKKYIEKDEKNDTEIEKLQTKRQSLHKELVRNKPNNIIRYKKDEYEKLCKKINFYDRIKNKVTFVNLSKIAHLQYQILSRFIGFAVDWERDMYFLLLGLCQNMGSHYKEKIDKTFESGNVVGRLLKLLEKNNNFSACKDYILNLYNLTELNNLKGILKIRNDIAHIDFLKYTNLDYTIIDSLVKLQNLMQYDRKKYNAITKSFIDLLEKENIIIKLKQEKTDNQKTISIDKIYSKKSEHLKNLNDKKLKFNINDKTYMTMVKKLLTYKVKDIN